MTDVPYDSVKRALDIAGAAILLVVTAPVQAAVAVLVVARLGTPVLFRQVRPGRDGRPFTLLKFRTMHPVDRARGRVDDVQRLGAFGRTLRSTSLDELPSLLNVLRGDMSMVGPRPLLMAYLPRYSSTEARRHEVRPGITGLAQVSGRNSLAWASRLELDVRYVDDRSLALDASIVARSLTTVLSRRGVSADGEATAAEFRGTGEGSS